MLVIFMVEIKGMVDCSLFMPHIMNYSYHKILLVAIGSDLSHYRFLYLLEKTSSVFRCSGNIL